MWHTTKSIWSDPDNAVRLVELLKSNPELSCKQIGERFGVSKNAIIGKMHRLGMSKKRPPPHSDCYVRPPLKPIGDRRKKPPRPISDNFMPKARVPLLVFPPQPRGTHAIAFIDAGPMHCRFPLWDDRPGPKLVCGNPIEKGSFCPTCTKKVYVPLWSKKRVA